MCDYLGLVFNHHIRIPSFLTISDVLTHEPSLSTHIIAVFLGLCHSNAIQLGTAMATRRIIVGVTGTNGAGKGTVVDRLVTKYTAHYSVRGYLLGEMKKRKIKNTDHDAMRRLANEIGLITRHHT